ncbi:MAG TPA: LL-diaminopimelate aminotransferase [Phycisphaerales bacterium]|nr:LL-diaminopimelate aminotransferase [Phycisphaerales bacterium]
MALLNENYLKLSAGYLFPEIARRVEAFSSANPAAAKNIIRCGIGDVTEPLPPAVISAMHAAVDDLARHETFHGYGPPLGYTWLREAIAKFDFHNHNLDIHPDEIFLSDGSKSDCGAILDVLGDKNSIAITDPVYPVYVDTNVMVGHTGPAQPEGSYAGLTYLPCTPANNFVPDIPSSHSPRLDVIYLCYPNNPTGGMISHDQLRAWVAYALANHSIILYDVAYQAYIKDKSLPRSIYEIEGAKRCAIEFHSFSKNGGFTGVRCGYTVCPKELFASTASGSKHALHALWSRRWATKSNSVSYIVQRGAQALYSEAGRAQVQSLIDHYLSNAATLRKGCEAAGLKVYGGVNAPYVWVACPEGFNSWSWFDHMLNNANIVITPGVGFGRCGEGFFRISAFNSKSNAAEVAKRLASLTATV